MSAASINHDTANPLMPLSNRISDLVNAEPCTKALATPLRRTLTSLHQYLHATDTADKTKHESNYAADSARLMTNLRTCLESLKNTSKEKFDGLMNYLRAFGEKLPVFLNFLNSGNIDKEISLSERKQRSYEHILSAITNFRPQHQAIIANNHSFSIKVGKKSQKDKYQEFTINNPGNFLRYIELFAQKKELSNQPLDQRGKMYFQLAYCLTQSLQGNNLIATEIQDKFDFEVKLLTNLKLASEHWNSSSSESKIVSGNLLREITSAEAQKLNEARQKKFPNDAQIYKLEDLIKVVNISRKMQGLFPKDDNISDSRELLAEWALNFNQYTLKDDFYNAKSTNRSSLSSALREWNRHFSNT